MEDTLFFTYGVTVLLLLIGSLLFMRGRDPAFKKRWQPRLALLSFIVIGGFTMIMLVTIMKPPPVMLLVFVATLLLIGFSWTKIRVCGNCGKTVQPETFFRASKFCPRCGAEIT